MTGVVEQFSPAFTALDKMPFRIVDYLNIPDLRQIVVFDVRGGAGGGDRVLVRSYGKEPVKATTIMFRVFFCSSITVKDTFNRM